MISLFSTPIPLTDRQKQILDLLSKQKTASFEFLAERLGRSSSAIRRDAAHLVENGLVSRYRGGVEIVNNQPRPVIPDLQTTSHWEEKNQIGKAAADLVSDGQMIAINAGTTAMAMANHLLERQRLTVVTADIEIAQLLISNLSFEVYLAGGQIQSEVPGVIGSSTLEMWKSFYFNLGFVGVRAINPKDGIMTTNLDQAASSRTVIEQSRQRVVLADSSKFHRRAGAVISPLSEIDILITDHGIESDTDMIEQLRSFKKLELIIV